MPSLFARRALAGLVAGSLAVTGTALLQLTPAGADEGFGLERLSGQDRYDTAATIARSSFGTADTVVLASGGALSFADALAGNYLAGALDGPVLLTDPASLPAPTRDALAALSARRVVIVGGTSAVSPAVEAELRRLGYDVSRLSGTDRYSTADAVARSAASAGVGQVGGQRTAILGNGQNFPDILAAGPLSYAEGLPILLTRPDQLPASTRQLIRDLGIQRIVIVGGPTAVSNAVRNELDALVDVVERIAGADRFGTAAEVADFAYDVLGFDDTLVDLARGDAFADALAGGPHSGRERAPIVLTFPGTLPALTRDALEERDATLLGGHVFGGPSAVSDAVIDAAVDAGTGTRQPAPSPSDEPVGERQCIRLRLARCLGGAVRHAGTVRHACAVRHPRSVRFAGRVGGSVRHAGPVRLAGRVRGPVGQPGSVRFAGRVCGSVRHARPERQPGDVALPGPRSGRLGQPEQLAQPGPRPGRPRPAARHPGRARALAEPGRQHR